ncbi:MAG TPA: nidogen-like domain-containing protein, partial [Candidatus Acidoferrum sp.]|nr:nidogen-like domain-containing protein [Candidatus Acidoferrum sp.]
MNFAKVTKALFALVTIITVLAMSGFCQSSSPIRSGFDQQILDRNDDDSTGIVPMGFLIDFYGNSHETLFVNNNGNVTFDNPQSTYSPQPLASLGFDIIAPFWADVDTRDAASDVVTYGTDTVNGSAA